MELRTWLELARNRLVVLLLLVTTLYMAGQFVIFTFMGPLLAKLTGASADATGLVFALYGVFGFLGVAIATRIVDGWGAYRTSLLSITSVLAGVAGWALTSGNYRADGDFSRGLGPWICLRQFDAAGEAGCRRAAAGLGVGLAQHLRPLCRSGDRVGGRRHPVRPGDAVRRGLCRHAPSWRRPC